MYVYMSRQISQQPSEEKTARPVYTKIIINYIDQSLETGISNQGSVMM